MSDVVYLGIDTGGTYTDAVVLAPGDTAVLAKAKALTTHGRLERGIIEAIDGLRLDLRNVALVGLSTTLATNALVEGHGGRVGLILIGYDPGLIDRWGFRRELVTEQVAFIDGGHDLSGREVRPLDEEGVKAAVERMGRHVDAWAVSGYFGVRNPDHELRAAELIRQMTGKPVTCGHELTAELDSIRRATTAALNARLIPLIQRLIEAVETALAQRGLTPQLMIVRGDGALVSRDVALAHPVETILSGPAASIVGAQALTSVRQGGVVDMGGTTTDLALLEDGRPAVRNDGARVGEWRTLVRAVDAHTVGLGGDSRVRVDGHQLVVGPERAIPLSMAMALHPGAWGELTTSLSDGRQPELLVLTETPDLTALTGTERQIVDVLMAAPCSFKTLEIRVPMAPVYFARPNRLEAWGCVRRASFTPTDALHVEGGFTAWDREAAVYAAARLGQRWGVSAAEWCQRVRAAVEQRLALAVVQRVMAASDGAADLAASPLAHRLVMSAWEPSLWSHLDVSVRLRCPLIALGAPAAAYFDRVAAMLGAELVLPGDADVANAIGAVSGSVIHRCDVDIRAEYDVTGITGYTVHTPLDRREFDRLEQAVVYARERGRELAIRGAREAGAGAVVVEEAVEEISGTTSWAEQGLYLGTRFRFVGIGRPALADPRADVSELDHETGIDQRRGT